MQHESESVPQTESFPYEENAFDPPDQAQPSGGDDDPSPPDDYPIIIESEDSKD